MMDTTNHGRLTSSERIRGSLLGHALGDAIGAKREGGWLARSLWFVLGLSQPGMWRTSDDTAMAHGTVRSILECGGVDVDHMARTWAAEARWSRGYGPGALKVLRRIRDGKEWRDLGPAHVYSGGSFGNGAAMRAAPLGLYLAERPELLETVRLASSVTHGHPLGIDGGVVLALATAQALRDERDIGELIAACSTEEFRTRLGAVEACLARRPEPRELAREFGRSIRALDSAVTALVAAWLHEDDTFEKLIAYCMAIGGDTDTIAAMAGGIYGARRGLEALPAAWLAKLENRANLDADAQALARRMSRRDEPDRYALEAVHAIDGAWRSMEPLRVGNVPVTLGEPVVFVRVTREGEPYLRIDVHLGEGELGPILLWDDLVCVASSTAVHLVELESREVATHEHGGWSVRLHATPTALLACTNDRVLCFDAGARCVWRSGAVGVDGVEIEDVREGMVLGTGDWDPPGGWRAFRLRLADGTPVPVPGA